MDIFYHVELLLPPSDGVSHHISTIISRVAALRNGTKQVFIKRETLCVWLNDNVYWPSKKANLILFQNVVPFVFDKLPKNRIRLFVALPLRIGSSNFGFQGWTLFGVHLLKDVSYCAEQRDASNPEQPKANFVRLVFEQSVRVLAVIENGPSSLSDLDQR